MTQLLSTLFSRFKSTMGSLYKLPTHLPNLGKIGVASFKWDPKLLNLFYWGNCKKIRVIVLKKKKKKKCAVGKIYLLEKFGNLLVSFIHINQLMIAIKCYI